MSNHASPMPRSGIWLDLLQVFAVSRNGSLKTMSLSVAIS